MTSSIILSLFFVFPLVYGNSHYDLHKLERSIGSKIVNAARDAGYEAEIVGLVIRNVPTCKNVVFNMNDWVNGNSFKKVVNDFLNINGKPTHVSLYNMKQARDAILEENRKAMKNSFDLIMQSINKWNEKTAATFVADVNVPIPEHVPTSVKASTSSEKNGEFKSLIFQAVEVKSFENDMKSLSNSLVESFRIILNSLKDDSLSTALFNHVGGDQEFRELAYKVLDREYNGSFVEEFGDRIAKLQKVTILGRRGNAIITEVCMTRGTTRDAHALVKIIPHGRIIGDVYTAYDLPDLYAATSKFNSLDDLLIAKSLFNQQNRAIADFRYQDPTCRLTKTALCQEEKVKLSVHNGTYFKQLQQTTLVMTKEKTGNCIDASGNIITFVPIEEPIFVHHNNYCLLQVGGSRIGNQTIEMNFMPKDFEPRFVPNDGGEDWFPKFDFHIGLTIGITGIVVILAMLVVFCMIDKCRQRKKTSTNVDKVFDKIDSNA